MQKFSPRSKDSEPHNGLPTPGVLHWKDEPPECQNLEASGTCVQERQRAVGKKDLPLLKGIPKISHAPTPSAETVNLKGP